MILRSILPIRNSNFQIGVIFNRDIVKSIPPFSAIRNWKAGLEQCFNLQKIGVKGNLEY